MQEFVIFGAGCVISWLIAHFYYHRSSRVVPDWAKPILENLPAEKPTDEALLKIFQEHLDSGKAKIDPFIGCVACPNCGESAKNFEGQGFGNNHSGVVYITCPSCGWSADVDV